MYVETTEPLTPDEILQQLQALVQGDPDGIACLANAAAILFLHVPEISWVGFYLQRGEDLVLGPFQGKPACTRIGPGRGVCGTSFTRGETLVVEDVNRFPGHIACDAASRSEVVVPLRVGGRAIGVLDCDAPTVARFGAEERALFERAAGIVGSWLEASGASV
ncbi:MAG: GAF domain-containing protein [Thermaerobacter sp.]|nr:GAF domain-containing protein [Thermaerobacter sp.]